MEAVMEKYSIFSLLDNDEYESVKDYASFLIKNPTLKHSGSIIERRKAAKAVVEELRKIEANADKNGWVSDEEVRKAMGI